DRYIAAGLQLIAKSHVDALTAQIDYLEKNHKISYHGWATPGGNPSSAALDMARTICRRAELQVAHLIAVAPPINLEILRYLNRLSDLCWLWARWLETPQ
ncbi:MAG: ATP:cob(I)alamin adenosyltransferase, partial [Verrucomicrobia bacterium]|nr:ATP:cob(I)alamin adenosyltransferase [Verrucomicrobiota bacterium]